MKVIERGVQEAIAQNSWYEVAELILAASLDVSICSSVAGRFARELVRKFRALLIADKGNPTYSLDYFFTGAD
jgi:hypothetical protein